MNINASYLDDAAPNDFASLLERSRHRHIDGAPHHPPEKNVGQAERIGSAIAGGGLLLCALRPKILPGMFWTMGGMVLGAGLIARAISGRCAMYERLGISTAGAETACPPLDPTEPMRSPADQQPCTAAAAKPPIGADTVDEASWESFPASDPPSSIVGGMGATALD